MQDLFLFANSYHRIYLNHIYFRSSPSSKNLKACNWVIKKNGEQRYLWADAFLVHQPSKRANSSTGYLVRGLLLSFQRFDSTTHLPVVRKTKEIEYWFLENVEKVNPILAPHNDSDDTFQVVVIRRSHS